MVNGFRINLMSQLILPACGRVDKIVCIPLAALSRIIKMHRL